MGLEACQSAVFRACHFYHSAAGRLVAKRPAASLVASLVVTLFLTACMLLGSWEARLEYRDTLSRSEAFKLFDATLDMFGGSPRTNEYKMSSSDGSNVLTKQAILKALEVDEAVLGLTYKGTRFEDVCLRPYLGGACTVDSAMYRLGLGREEVEALSQEELDSKLLAEYNSNAGGLGSLLGGLTLTDGKLSATSLRFRYLGEPSGQGRPSFVEFVTGTSNDALASATLEWESAFLALVCARPLMSSGIECATDSLSLGEGLSVTGTAQRFIQDEIAANATTSTKWMVVSINLILVLMWLALGGRPLRNSRLTLGTGAVAVILLSVGAGLGFSSLVGVPLTEISLLMVFVIVGVGVDDVIVVVDFLQRQPPHLSIVERISGALSGAGPAIQLTSLTNLIAFLIAATVDFPGVSYFCLSAGFTLFALFLLTTTLFTALLTFDERRRGAMRLDCLCCIGFGAGDSETGDAEPSSPSHKEDDKRAHSGLRAAVSSAARAYDCFVASKPVALVVILAFTSLIPLGFGFAIGNIPLGAELASYFPDGSPYVAYTADTQENFVALDTPGYLVLRDVKWEDASAQTAVDSLLAALDSDDFVIAPYSTNNWLAAYRAVAADRGATASAAPPLRQSGDGFLADVAAFLKETDPQCVDRQLGGECLREIIPARYSKEVVWAGEAGASPITATRFSCTLAVPDEVKGRVELMNEHRATADANRGSIDAVVWSYFMLFSDRDRIVVRLVLETLAFAAAAVLGTLVFFLHPLSVAVIALAIASIDGGIFLLMYLWAVPLDAVAFICLAMSIGLSVDYVVHVAHAFEHEEGTPEQRIKAALHGIGWSVLKGGGSTFLGVVALAGADSEIFRTFFKMLFSTVLLGLLAGLVLFPACVIFVGKWITPKLLEKTPAGVAQADAVAKPAAAAEPPALQAQLERY